MTRFTRRLVLACLIVLTACVTASGRARAADQEKADKADKKRQELWQCSGEGVAQEVPTDRGVRREPLAHGRPLPQPRRDPTILV